MSEKPKNNNFKNKPERLNDWETKTDEQLSNSLKALNYRVDKANNDIVTLNNNIEEIKAIIEERKVKENNPHEYEGESETF